MRPLHPVCAAALADGSEPTSTSPAPPSVCIAKKGVLGQLTSTQMYLFFNCNILGLVAISCINSDEEKEIFAHLSNPRGS